MNLRDLCDVAYAMWVGQMEARTLAVGDDPDETRAAFDRALAGEVEVDAEAATGRGAAIMAWIGAV